MEMEMVMVNYASKDGKMERGEGEGDGEGVGEKN
jgi:hypothetical protein